jgi:hypothetical protein
MEAGFLLIETKFYTPDSIPLLLSISIQGLWSKKEGSNPAEFIMEWTKLTLKYIL